MNDTPAATPRLHTSESVVINDGVGWNLSVDRIRVDGGWLYVTLVSSMQGMALQQTLVPDTEPPTSLQGLDIG